MDKTSQNLSLAHSLFRSGGTPATSSGPSGLFGPPVQPSPGTLFGAPANGGQPPPFSSPEVAINAPGIGNPGLSSASAPTFSSPGQGHQIISIELGLLRRKNDDLEKEAEKLRKEKNDLKEDAKRWREGKHELESLAQLFDAAKKKLDAEEVLKDEELTRNKIELQLALLKVAHLQDELEKEQKNAENVKEGSGRKMKDMQTQTENSNYEVQGPQGENEVQEKINDVHPPVGWGREFGKRRCAEDSDEARKKGKREVMATVDMESSPRESSNQQISIECNKSDEGGPLLTDLPDEEIKIVAEVNNSNPGDVPSKAEPKKYQLKTQKLTNQPNLKASQEERVNVVETVDRSARDNTTTENYGTSWHFVQNGVVEMVFCPLCPFRPSGKFPSTRVKPANLEPHLRKVHIRNYKTSLFLWCPDCGESVSAPSLPSHLKEHKKRNSNNGNCQAVAGRAPRPARKIWAKKDIFVPGVLADNSI